MGGLDEKELIWVSKKLAEEYKQLNSVEKQEQAVKKVINEKRLDLEEEQELLSENVLLFKSVCLAHRKALEGVYKEQSEILDRLWEDMGDVSTIINQHVKKMVEQVKPLTQQVDTLKKVIESLHLYVPEQLVNLAVRVGTMDENTKSLLRTLLNIKNEEGIKDEKKDHKKCLQD